MKQPKKPTLEQKKIMSNHGLVWENWSVLEEKKDKLIVISKRSKQRRILMKS